MDIGTSNAEVIVNVGSAANLYSLYSTVSALMGRQNRKVSIALDFLEKGNCAARKCGEAAAQLVRICEELENHAPSDAVWDIGHPNIKAPWGGHLSPTIVNCLELYTTADGEPLLAELLSLLRYAELKNCDVVVLG